MLEQLHRYTGLPVAYILKGNLRMDNGEMKHLPTPRKIRVNVSYHYYRSGHMVYAHVPALKELHDNVATFIAATDRLP